MMNNINKKNNQLKTILKTCFLEYNFTEDDIVSLTTSQNQQEQMFLFTKIIENAKELIKSMKIFDKEDLKSLIDSYTLPIFKQDYMVRRLNIIEYYFLDRPLTIDELKWVA